MLKKFFKNSFNSMLFKLVLYFIIIILITLSLSSYFTYNYFSSAFKDEVLQVNHKILSQLSIFADDSVIGNINETILNLALDNDADSHINKFFNSSLSADSSLILGMFNKIDDIMLSKRGLIDSVYIHSRDRKLLISTYYMKNISEEDLSQMEDLNWIDEFYKSPSGLKWMKTRNSNIYSDVNTTKGDVITVVCPYPISSSSEDIKGFISFNLNENALNKSLVKFNSMNFGQLLIMDSKGSIVSHSDKQKLYCDISNEAFVKSVLNHGANDFVTNYEKSKYVVSYTHSQYNDWYFISLVPVELFYQRDFEIKKKILFISIIILFAVFSFSNFFTYKIYIPFRKIIDKYTSRLSSSRSEGLKIKEYNILDDMFCNMSSKINDLQSTLDKNSYIIRQNLLNDLINNRLSTNKDIEDTLSFLGITFKEKYYSAVAFMIDELLVKSNHQNTIQFYKHSISDFISTLNAKGKCSYSILAIVNTDSVQEVNDFVNCVENYCYSNFNFYLICGVGSLVDSPILINKSYKHSRLVTQYKYIYPEKHIFYYDDIINKASSETEIPDDFYVKISKSINTRTNNNVSAAMDEFKQFVKDNNIIPGKAKRTLTNFASIYMEFLEEMDINPAEIDENIHSKLVYAHNIDEFIDIYCTAVSKAYEIMAKRKLNKNSEIIQMVKQYVIDNIDTEISLSSTASSFYISPYHMSRVFKKETGVNYIDYVVQVKMEKAIELLTETDLSIEQITNSIGYKHSTYFCRKFKEYTGKTPNEYRIGAHLGEVSDNKLI